MTFWVVRCKDVCYQFNVPPDSNEFPYYDCVTIMLEEEGGEVDDALSIQCDDYYYKPDCPTFLNLGSLQDKDIKKISLLMVSQDDSVNTTLNDELTSLSTELQQYLYEKLSELANKPYVSNSSEITPEKVREFLVTSTKATLSKITDRGSYPLKCLLEALNSKDIYSTFLSSCTLHSDIKDNIFKNLPIQELARRIGNSSSEYIEDLARYLPTSAVNIISRQKIKSISDVIDIIKKLTPYEVGSIISMLPIDKVNILKRAIDSKISYNSHNSEKKTLLVDKLKNNKLL